MIELWFFEGSSMIAEDCIFVYCFQKSSNLPSIVKNNHISFNFGAFFCNLVILKHVSMLLIFEEIQRPYVLLDIRHEISDYQMYNIESSIHFPSYMFRQDKMPHEIYSVVTFHMLK